jgi:hypothetical protein
MLKKAHREEALLKRWGNVRRQAAQHLLDLQDLLQRLDPNKVGVKGWDDYKAGDTKPLEGQRNAILIAADEEIKILRQTIKKERERTRELEAQRDEAVNKVILLQNEQPPLNSVQQVFEQDKIRQQIEICQLRNYLI